MADGLVTAPHPAAAEAGASALAAGGSAVDAAIAANAAAAVAMGHMCGVGGDLFALVDRGDGSAPLAVNASGPASHRVDADRLAALGGVSPRTAAAVTVPGAVDGWRVLHEAAGRLDWKGLFGAAIALADGGVAMTSKTREWAIEEREAMAADPESRRVYLDDGQTPEVGQVTRFPDLARTLETIASQGARSMYEGELGRQIAARTALDPDGLDADDLAGYRARIVPPASAEVGGDRIVTTPPNSQGATCLILLSALARRGADPRRDDWPLAFLEAKRAAFGVRDRELARSERHDRALDPAEIEALRELGESARIPPESTLEGDTIALATRDAGGMTCVVIQSLYFTYGSAITVPGTGILLQNRGAYFATAPGHPNRIAPGRRTLHTLMPVFAYRRGGGLRAAVGTMGGDGQPQVIAQILARHITAGDDIAAAVQAPRILHGRYMVGEPDDVVHAEDNYGSGPLAAIASAGHQLVTHPWPSQRMGHACGIAIGDGGRATATSDPRSDGVALRVPD